MRSPPGGISGFIVKKIMRKINAEGSAHAVELLKVQKNSICVEVGAGCGHALRTILAQQPARVIGIEISASLRADLGAEFAGEIERGVLDIRGDDAANLSFLADATVDRVLAMNVIYFLDPLDVYLAEVFRILRPGGLVLFGVKDLAKGQDPTVFVHQDWGVCIDAMRNAGFEAEMHAVQLEGMAAYVPLVGVKPR